ncbi:MAG: diguanylate cyclase domain-containing protein [Bacillota bacterium]
MPILVVDDSKVTCKIIKNILNTKGHKDVITAESAMEAFNQLYMDDVHGKTLDVDLIILDIVMPFVNGIDACRLIKSDVRYREVPIIMLTGVSDKEILQSAFFAGAIDYIVKPPDAIELLARTNSALKLKRETDMRIAREIELLETTKRLEEANRILYGLSSIDGLTGISNRRYFDTEIKNEWDRAARYGRHLSIILFDIDYFKDYNDIYGHLAGDDCLKQIANALQTVIKRSGDIFARYGGEEFVVVLAETDLNGAMVVAERLRENVESLKITHAGSKVSENVTISVGVAAAIPDNNTMPESLIGAADKALYKAKRQGRNCVLALEIESA